MKHVHIFADDCSAVAISPAKVYLSNTSAGEDLMVVLVRGLSQNQSLKTHLENKSGVWTSYINK